MKKNNPASTKQKNVERLRELLTQPEYRGRKVKPAEIIHKLGRSREWFYRYIGNTTLAQEWLAINQDASLDLKAHYKSILDKAVETEQAEVTVISHGKNGERQHYVSRQEAQEKTKKIHNAIKNSAPSTDLKIVEKTEKNVPVTEEEAIINRIREAYVMAPVGDTPNIGKIMTDFGLVDRQGKPTRGELTESAVRAKAIAEDWRAQRTEFMYRTFDLIPEEIKMISMIRNVEVQKTLYNEIKAVHRLNLQVYQTGQAKSFDGKVTLAHSPDPGVLASLAEVMRRMVEGGGNVNIQINQFGAGGREDKGAISAMSRAYMARLAAMDENQVKEEIERFEKLVDMLGDRPEENLTIEKIEAEDAEIVEDNPSKPQS